MNRDEIQELIPHRAPFLWLDEIVEINETAVTARKHLAPDLPVFQGHYPNFPVFPGVLQCEACFQAGAVLIASLMKADGTADDDLVPVVTRINNTQFRKMVGPNQTIEIEAELTDRLSNAYYLKGRVRCDGKVTARMEFVCTAAPAGSE